jgi:hypothetical protein
MIVGERTLRNKIPETLKSGCLGGRRGDRVGRSRKFTPARCEMDTPLLSGRTKGNQQTEDEFCSESILSSLWPQTEPKAAKQPRDFRVALPELGLVKTSLG